MYHTLFIHENYLLKCKSDHVRFLFKTPQWLPMALSQRLPMAGMPSSSFCPSASVLWPRGPLPNPGTSQALSQPHTHVALCLEPSSLLPWRWFILFQMLPPWWGLPSPSLFQHPVYFLHIIWLLWWLVYCLSPLLGMGASQDADLAVWVTAVGSVRMLWWAPGWMGAVGLSAGGVTCRDLVSLAYLS